MKKKGLIVATIVMVLVLAVSLTTATYAWFTTSDSTSIEGFNLTVVAGNAMNIGLNKQGYTSYSAGATADNFVSGECEYVADTTPGQFAGGYWTGTVASLSSTVEHNIYFGDLEKAVGFTTADEITGANFSNTKTYADGYKHVVKGSGDSVASLTQVDYAIANRNGTGTTQNPADRGDYVYMFLGAQPTKALQAGTNKLYIVVQVQGAGSTIGMASAVHVAYNKNGTGWKDVDVFGADDPETTGTVEGKHYKDAKAGLTAEVYGDYSDGFGTDTGAYNSGTKKTTFQNAQVVVIDLTEYTDVTQAAPLDQIQLLIYVAGADSDCNDMSKAGQIGIGIFFGAQEAAA